MKRKIDKLLEYASKNIPFYFGYGRNLLDYPFVDKKIIKSNYISFISKNFCIRQELVNFLLQDMDITDYVIEQMYTEGLRIEWTSGSSGIPFKTIKTKEERYKISLDMWKRRREIDKIISPKNFLPIIHTGIKPFPYNIRDYSRTNLKDIYNYIKKKNIICLHTSPQILLRHIEQPYFKENMPSHIKYIECTGRYLSDENRNKIENEFGAKVINMYGTIETWEIACTCKCNKMHINTSNVFVELIDKDGNRIDKSDEVGQIVVTSLNLYSLPYIRYLTNDYASFSFDKCCCGNPNPILNIVPYREIHFGKIRNEIFNGEDYMRGIIKKIFFEKGFQRLNSILLEQLSLHEFVLYVNDDLENKETFVSLFRKHCSFENEVTIIFDKQSSIDGINDKQYLFRRKF